MGDIPETVMNTGAGAHALLKNGRHLANNRVATILELRNVGLTIKKFKKTSIEIKFYLHGTVAVCGTRFSQTRGPSSHRIH